MRRKERTKFAVDLELFITRLTLLGCDGFIEQLENRHPRTLNSIANLIRPTTSNGQFVDLIASILVSQ